MEAYKLGAVYSYLKSYLRAVYLASMKFSVLA